MLPGVLQKVCGLSHRFWVPDSGFHLTGAGNSPGAAAGPPLGHVLLFLSGKKPGITRVATDGGIGFPGDEEHRYTYYLQNNIHNIYRHRL